METWRKVATEDPACKISAAAVMPDHFHGLIITRQSPKWVIGTHVSRVAGRTLHAIRKQLNDPTLKMWDKGFYDYLALDSQMLANIRN